MFAKLSTLALALVLPLVSALTINAPTNPTTGNVVTITWTAQTTDSPYFSIELVNTVFNNQYAIANNVQTTLGYITLQLPQVPVGAGYTLAAIATNNINTIYSTSGSFSIGAAGTSSTSGASTISSATSTSSGTVSTPSATATSPVSSPSVGVSSAASSGASTAASSSPSTFSSSGAASFKIPGVVPAAALVLFAVAGAAMVF